MATDTDIANMALDLIGERAIQSINDDSKRARACLRHYPTARDKLLKDADWGFALERAALAQLAGNPLYGYDFHFQLPTDPPFLRLVEHSDTDKTMQWVIEGDTLLISDFERDAELEVSGLSDDCTLVLARIDD